MYTTIAIVYFIGLFVTAHAVVEDAKTIPKSEVKQIAEVLFWPLTLLKQFFE